MSKKLSEKKVYFILGMGTTIGLTTTLWTLLSLVDAGLSWVLVANVLFALTVLYLLKQTKLNLEVHVKEGK